MNGSMAIGSWRREPTLASAEAAVWPEESIAPIMVPCSQLWAWVTSGTVSGRRPPKRMASIFTPCQSLNSGAAAGHCSMATQ